MDSDTSGQRQIVINQLIVLKEDLADIEADWQAATTESERQKLRQAAGDIRHEIAALETQLSSTHRP
jgi:hypothetical protein